MKCLIKSSAPKFSCLATIIVTALIAAACGVAYEPSSSTNRPTGFERPEGSFELNNAESALSGRVFVRNYPCALGGENATCNEKLSFAAGKSVVYENSFSTERQRWQYETDGTQIIVKSDDVADLIVFAFVVQDNTIVDRDGSIFVEQL
jgi:hypothetical protein